jgi:hypothetical protein
LERRHAQATTGQDDVWRERDQFRRVFASRVGIACAPAILDPHVAAVAPAQLLQALLERRDTGLRFGIAHGQIHEHRDAPHSLRLLRGRRQGPRGRRAAEQRYEFAAFHCRVPPVLPTYRIAHLSYGRRPLHCGILLRPMTAAGQNR